MDDELLTMLKYLKLPGLISNWDQYLSIADKGNFSHVRLLKHIVGEEYAIRKEKSRHMSVNRAKIPEKFVIETFPFEQQPKLSRKKIMNIYDSDYLSRGQNIIWVGAPERERPVLPRLF